MNEYYLTIGKPAGSGPEILGESLTITNAIEISTFKWGAKQPGSAATGSGQGTGKVEMEAFSFTVPMNKSSPALMNACAIGCIYPACQLICREAGGAQETYLIVDFKDVLITSYSTGGSEGKPVDECTFNFGAIRTQYGVQDEKGKVKMGAALAWSVKKNLPTFATV